jgi:hypothetical protein
VRIQRAERRSPFNCLACLAVLGLCGIIGVVAGAILITQLPGLVLATSGFAPRGDTNQAFVGNVAAAPIQLENAAPASDAVVSLPQVGTQPLPPNPSVYQIETGMTNGVEAARVTVTESGLLDLCRQRSTFCTTGNNQIRNLSLDLRPGGAIVYGDFFVPQVGIWQSGGLVLRLDPSRTQLEIAGVDIGGILYSVPTSPLGDQITQAAREANILLRQAVLEAAGGTYSLAEMRIDDTTLTFLMR